MSNVHEIASNLAMKMAESRETMILEQLNEFVSRGLIILEVGPVSFVSSEPPGVPATKLEVRQTVKLRLKDQDYVERLEKENKEMRDIMNAFRDFLPG